MSLAAVLIKNNINVHVIVSSNEQHILKRIRKIKPDLICFNSSTSEFKWIRNLSSNIKQQAKIPIVVGGIHATTCPEIVSESCIDYVCRGEGDKAMLDLVHSLGSGTINQIQNVLSVDNIKERSNFLKPSTKNLNELPFPVRSVYRDYPQIYNSKYAVFVVGRGCPFNCHFCYTNYLRKIYKPYNEYVRLKSPEYLVHEIMSTVSRIKPTRIQFCDTTFPFDIDWLNGFIKYYSKIKIPFSINVRAGTIGRKYLSELSRLGCFSITMGVESGNDKIRNAVLGKNLSKEEIIETAKLIKDAGIKLGTFNIIGSPDEDLDMVIETIMLNRRLKPDYVLCNFLHPFPGTDVTKYSRERNLLENNLTMKGYFSPNPIIKSDHQDFFKKLRLLFPLLVKLRISSSAIKRIARNVPHTVCRKIDWYNTYLYKRFYNLAWREAKSHLKRI